MSTTTKEQAPTEGLIDRLLDRTVVPGYTVLGHYWRSRSWKDGDPLDGSLSGRRAVVTGGGRGLGETTASALALLGAEVTVVARSGERAATALEHIEAALAEQGGPGSVRFAACDVADPASVRAFADDLLTHLDGAALDVLVHNAGTMPPERTESPDGHELTVATHVLGPVLMTELLLPALSKADGGARTIWVSSGGMYTQKLPVDDPDYRRGTYKPATAYARSKRMQVDLTPVLADHWAPHRVAVHCTHPGWADTPGVVDSLPLFHKITGPLLRDAEQGADTAVWLAATQPPPESGHFWHDRVIRPTAYGLAGPTPADDVQRMWTWVRAQVGI